jgi:hypothetical protein
MSGNIIYGKEYWSNRPGGRCIPISKRSGVNKLHKRWTHKLERKVNLKEDRYE